MSNRVAVIYQSHYGSTQRYAEWIAEELNAELMERKKAPASTLANYDIIVYGGGLYAGGILGADLVAKSGAGGASKLVVFTVGLADPQTTDYASILKRSFPEGKRQPNKVFHLRGGIDYKKLTLVHRGMMAMVKKNVERGGGVESNDENKVFLESYGGEIDFTDRETIMPILEYVRGLPNTEGTTHEQI